MARPLPGVDSLGDVAGKRVLVRSDLNVPLDDGRITDDGRIRASVPQIRSLLDAGAKVVVCAHLGRPKGTPDPRYSLAPVASRLGELLGRDVAFVDDLAANAAGDVLGSADVALLENVRFNAGETSKDEADRAGYADALAALADVYVDDAFGAVHRKHASVYDVAQRLPHAAGDLVRREVEVLQRLTENPERPYVVVLGGSKVSDKLKVIESLLPRVDTLLVGGGMCFTFLSAQGHDVGDSLLQADHIDVCKELLSRTTKIDLPEDVVALGPSGEVQTGGVNLPAGWKGLDIGPYSAAIFSDVIAGARTVLW